ncbi:MAG: hypothetical protein ACXWYD_15145 [Candidatus Binatia bacterium]
MADKTIASIASSPLWNQLVFDDFGPTSNTVAAPTSLINQACVPVDGVLIILS